MTPSRLLTGAKIEYAWRVVNWSEGQFSEQRDSDRVLQI
jgi:hypothetical protein